MSLTLLSRRGVTRPSPVMQAPLPPFDTAGNPNTTLPANQTPVPQALTGPLWLENAWSMTIPGLPWLPGLTSSVHPERCLTWFLGHPLWADWIDKILTAACQKGYNTFTLSWPDCRQFMTLDAYVALAVRVKSWQFRVHHKWWSKDYDPIDSTWADFGLTITPVLQALIAAQAIDFCSPWEWNAGNIPGDQGNAILQGVSSVVMPAGVKPCVHFTAEVTSWQTDGTSRFDWWAIMAPYLTGGLLYQAQPIPPWSGGWDTGTRQARYLDTTGSNQFAGGVFPVPFIAWEAQGAEQFDQDQPDEAHGAMQGFLDLCTPGRVPVAGVGGGAWLQDGTPLTSLA
jgi:hypothetical protein